MKKNPLQELKKAELLLWSCLTKFFENFANTKNKRKTSNQHRPTKMKIICLEVVLLFLMI
jgi:hypothetical protein